MQSLLVEATHAFKLRDVALYSARFERPFADTGSAFDEAVQQHKQGVTFTVGENSDSKRLLQVCVSLGLRVVPRAGEDGEAGMEPLFVIEADFVVEYEMVGDLSEEAIKAFAQFNAVHNAWPFWRQHVFSVVEKGRLPRLDVPLYEGVVL